MLWFRGVREKVGGEREKRRDLIGALEKGRRGSKKALQWKPKDLSFRCCFFSLFSEAPLTLHVEVVRHNTTSTLHCVLLCPFPSYSVVLFPVRLVDAGDLRY